MQCILREKLLAQALKLADVSTIYRTESNRFVNAYIGWLEETEKDLSGLRSSICILLQAERTSLISVLDGYLPIGIREGRSIRKNQKAVAAQSMEKISKEIYSIIDNIDRNLDQLSDKLCHAIAVLMTKEPEVYEKLQLNQQGVNTIWEMLGRTSETIPMYNYFCTKLAQTDKDYLLIDIIQKIVSNKPTPQQKSHSRKRT
jgi:hypothetical protein